MAAIKIRRAASKFPGDNGELEPRASSEPISESAASLATPIQRAQEAQRAIRHMDQAAARAYRSSHSRHSGIFPSMQSRLKKSLIDVLVSSGTILLP